MDRMDVVDANFVIDAGYPFPDWPGPWTMVLDPNMMYPGYAIQFINTGTDSLVVTDILFYGMAV